MPHDSRSPAPAPTRGLATRLCERAVIRLSGDDAAGFLQGLITTDVTKSLPVWSALLSPQGKVLFDFFVWLSGEDMLIDCEAEHAEELIRRLSLYRLRRKIDITVDPKVTVHWNAHPGDGGADDPRLSALGQRWLEPVDEGDAACADAAYREHRLSLGVTEGRAELGHDQTLWLECNAGELHGVSFDKGCYIGQENTARMNWRQKVNRRLTVVPIQLSDEKRRRIAYDDLGLAVDHRRVDAIDADVAPRWMAKALVAGNADPV
ncbi:YgfZ/GcvT domain-containing protein [Croceicoccus hydrothermalis]|uniref:CAF17-like 4Fe-4S cluster assembly/insertion protein YgfZ n=1 Tax=Croceicoccus hydrothermalis TaxID=2867964 RepID=UPI001EFBDE2D|nr:folate-binding protein [Croceicoccus hydrothermalis]